MFWYHSAHFQFSFYALAQRVGSFSFTVNHIDLGRRTRHFLEPRQKLIAVCVSRR
jgi:hypothetical protein